MAQAVIVGGGVIGGGWAARFLLNGWDVVVVDPDPEAERKIGEVLANARRSLPSLYDRPLPSEGALTFSEDLVAACAAAAWVQESVPERLEVKHAVLGAICAAVPDGCVVASSTSGFKPSELCAAGASAIVAHPFNPVYLLPLIELVGDPQICARASEILTEIGMYPLHVRKEIDAHIADRFLEAVWREALWLVKDGIATTEEIDEAIRMGFGLRWAQMGLFETYRVAGGEAGMKHFMAQFGPALKWPWTKLMDVPEFTDELVDLIAGQSDAQSGDKTIRALERQRDDNLVGILRALKHTDSGAGAVLNAHDQSLQVPQSGDLPITLQRQIPQTWVDYNGHMNEARYMEAASVASDKILEMIGAWLDYVAAGGSFFTVENHVRYLEEMRAGDTITVRTRVLDGAGKKLHLFHYLTDGAGTLCATVETILIHVDMKTRRAAPPTGDVPAKMAALAAAHAQLPVEPEAGRVGRRRA